MDAEILVSGGDGTDDAGELAGLRDWLLGERELAGTVRQVSREPRPDEPLQAAGTLTVAVGAGGAAGTLASSLLAWLRSRRPTLQVTVTTAAGRVQVRANQVRNEDVLRVLREVLQADEHPVELPDYSRSLAMLIGTSSYQDPAFSQLPAAANSLAGMSEILQSELCGWPAERITRLHNATDNREVIARLRQSAQDTEGVFLLYYVGHGFPAANDLSLTVTDTQAEYPDITGVEYRHIRRALLDSPAQVKIVILDCCYSGRTVPPVGASAPAPAAIAAPAAANRTDAAARSAPFTDIKGTWVMGAGSATYPEPENELACTSFTGELLELIRTGIPDGPPGLTLDDIYRTLRSRLRAAGLPEPSRGASDTAGTFSLARNAAVLPGSARHAGTLTGDRAASYPHTPEPIPFWRRWLQIEGGQRVRELATEPGGRDLTATDAQSARDVVLQAFSSAGRDLHETSQGQLLEPGPVWVYTEAILGHAELERFGRALVAGQPGYLVHAGELSRPVTDLVDQMRVSGKKVVTVSVRALQSALAADQARSFLDELERLYGSKDNLFDTKNALVDDRFLFGRDAMLTRIGSAIGRGEHVLITGLRKVGKTSLLNILRQHLVNYPVCQVDLQRFDRHNEDWPPSLFALMVESVDRWGRLQHPEWPFAAAAPATATKLEKELDRRFTYLETEPGRQRVVVMLDEVERVFPRRGETSARRRWETAAGALRSLAQGSHRRVVIIAADLRPTANRENDLGGGETNPFFSFFQEIPVGLLDHGATRDLLESLARSMGVDSVSKDFTDRVFALTGGHPSLTRTVAGEAYRERASPARLEAADLEQALASLEDADAVGAFVRSNLWQPMTPAEKDVLNALSGRFARATRRRRADVAFAQGYASLRSQGIVDDRRIRISLLRDWVRDHDPARTES